MSVFTPLKGIDHTKAYIKDASYKASYKQWIIDTQNNWITQLSEVESAQLSNDTNTFYIMTPSLYKKGCIQLTTFINNLPHSHATYTTVNELVKENYMHLTINNYTMSV